MCVCVCVCARSLVVSSFFMYLYVFATVVAVLHGCIQSCMLQLLLRVSSVLLLFLVSNMRGTRTRRA